MPWPRTSVDFFVRDGSMDIVYHVSSIVGKGRVILRTVALTITSKHSILLLEQKHHMINGMSRCMECCQSSTFNREHLALVDIRLIGIRLVFEDLSLGTEFA